MSWLWSTKSYICQEDSFHDNWSFFRFIPFLCPSDNCILCDNRCKIMQILTCIPRHKKLFMDFVWARFYNIKLRQRNPFGALNQENEKECESLTTIELHCASYVRRINQNQLWSDETDFTTVWSFSIRGSISLSLYISLLVLYQTKFTKIVHFGKLIQSNILPFNFWPKICKGRVTQDTCGGEFWPIIRV